MLCSQSFRGLGHSLGIALEDVVDLCEGAHEILAHDEGEQVGGRGLLAPGLHQGVALVPEQIKHFF